MTFRSGIDHNPAMEEAWGNLFLILMTHEVNHEKAVSSCSRVQPLFFLGRTSAEPNLIAKEAEVFAAFEAGEIHQTTLSLAQGNGWRFLLAR